MIQPDEIRRKADNLYRDCLKAWLEGDDTFFPRIIPANRTLDQGNVGPAVEAVRRLREGSKESLGFGYSVEWREVNSRRLGRNKLPARIFFETLGDYLRFVGKEKEFAAFIDAVTRLRTEFPELGPWVRSNVQRMLEIGPDLEGLFHVVRFLREHPRPNLFARELPIAVDTKFIERRQGLLREWLDAILPTHVVRADEDHFERRYGLRYAEPHLYVRLLDPDLARELSFPCLEFSLPLHTLEALAIQPAAVVIVENKVNLLTLPPQKRTLGLGALGKGVTLLRYIPWLRGLPILYWGDLDVQGFEILSSIRACFPQTRSILMDEATLDRWEHLCTCGNAAGSPFLPHLTGPEHAAYNRCRGANLRLEQERLPNDEVLAAIGHWPGGFAFPTTVEPASAASDLLSQPSS